MNRRALDALLSAGIITLEQHQAGLASIDATGRVTHLPEIEMQLPGQVTLDADSAPPAEEWDGIVTGTITAYGVYIPSHGMILEAGCLEPRQPLDRVKLMRDHDHAQPLGYMLSIDAAGEEATFQVAPGERARVLQEIKDKLRDGMSVGVTFLEYEIDDDWVLHVIKAVLNETSLCALPAIVQAGVTHVAAALATLRKENTTMNREQLAAALAAGRITQEQHDAALATLDALATPAPVVTPPTPPAELTAGPELLPEQPASPARTASRGLSLRDANRQLASAANSGDREAFRRTLAEVNQAAFALADVLPEDDAGQAFHRPDWQGEAWRNDDNLRPWIDAFGTPAELTSIKGEGWEWETEPDVDEYDGDKTEVPSNEIATAPKEYVAFQIAAGWDVQRSYEDFASEAFWDSFWRATMRSYKVKSNAGIRTRVLAKATAPTGTVTAGGVKAVLKQVIKDVRPYGKVNRVFLGDDLFEELEDLDTQNLPLWLKSAVVGVDVAEGEANINELRILNDGTLADKQVVAFDSRAALVREKSPFRLQAIDLAHGGIDVGMYSYLRFDDYDARAIVKRTYVPA